MIIMTSNLWDCDFNLPAWAARGQDCSAAVRTKGFIRAYTSVMPDILGFEEMSMLMETMMINGMRRIQLTDGTTARYKIITGGCTPIMFRNDRLLLLESGHLLYPTEFPPYEGSFNNNETKSYTYGVFEERSTGKRIIVFATHLWYKSDDPDSGIYYQPGSAAARAHQIVMATERVNELIAKYNCPAILMGDLNAKLGSPCLDAAFANGWQETHDVCVGERCEARGYHHCAGDGWSHDEPGEYANAIDHILIKNAGTAVVNRFSRFMEEFFDCLSDHYPVYIDLTL